MPLPKLDELRNSAKGAVEMASGRLEKASGGKFKLMKVSSSDPEAGEGGGRDGSSSDEVSETSSRFEEFTDTFCPKLTFQQVRTCLFFCRKFFFSKHFCQLHLSILRYCRLNRFVHLISS